MARVFSKEYLLSDELFERSLSPLNYPSLETAAERYSSLTEGSNGDCRFFSASGRAELLGNHTDHNRGRVLAAAIDRDVVAAARKTDNDFIRIRGGKYPEFTVSLSDLSVDERQFGSSDALLKGVLKGFLNRGYAIGGFDADTRSNIEKGAGVSSSAAFELLLCEIINDFYNDGKVRPAEKAAIGRFAENVYFGKPSGLMDQLTIARGGVSFMDFATEESESVGVAWPFADLEPILVNCGGDHCELTGEYAAIRKDMASVSRKFGKNYLREVSEKDFLSALPELRKELSGRAILRAMHFFDEEKRVERGAEALNSANREEFLRLVRESGTSSRILLQNVYPTGDTVQSVNLALEILKRNDKILASRVHGGGFAGTVLCFADKDGAKEAERELETFFGEGSVFGVAVRQAGATEIKF